MSSAHLFSLSFAFSTEGPMEKLAVSSFAGSPRSVTEKLECYRRNLKAVCRSVGSLVACEQCYNYNFIQSPTTSRQ